MIGVGRPKIDIITDDIRDQIISLRLIGTPWNLIAESFNISVKVLRNYRNVSLGDPLSNINDELLAPIISKYQQGWTNLFMYILSALGYFVSQEQLGRVVRLVDPEGIYEWVGIIKYNFFIYDYMWFLGIAHRHKHQSLKRRAYNVFRRHMLWHIDGLIIIIMLYL